MQTGFTIHQNEPKLKLLDRFQYRFSKINFYHNVLCIIRDETQRHNLSTVYSFHVPEQRTDNMTIYIMPVLLHSYYATLKPNHKIFPFQSTPYLQSELHFYLRNLQ
jgi:hypothetical protein